MNEFIEKLIERLEEEKRAQRIIYSSIKNRLHREMCNGKIIAFGKTIEIVNQLAEEYSQEHDDTDYSNIELNAFWQKHQWIPCSEKLPPKPENNMLFENKPLELYLATVKDLDYAWRVFWNGEYFTDGWNKVDVIAWQELPKVHKSKEGES